MPISYLPSDVELMAGRVDLANMPGNAVPGTWPNETELLRNYLNKDHKWRFKQISVPRLALMADRFGDSDHEARAATGYRNFTPFVGHGNIILADISDTAPPTNRWISLISSNTYLWTYGCGGGQDTSISELGLHGQYFDVWSTDIYAQDAHAVFFMLEGSWFGNWDHTDNIMRSTLATPTMGLACCCIAGHPHWYIHHMGLGEPIGYGARLTMNNSTLYQSNTNENDAADGAGRSRIWTHPEREWRIGDAALDRLDRYCGRLSRLSRFLGHRPFHQSHRLSTGRDDVQ